jgi:hypothetical protein
LFGRAVSAEAVRSFLESSGNTDANGNLSGMPKEARVQRSGRRW